MIMRNLLIRTLFAVCVLGLLVTLLAANLPAATKPALKLIGPAVPAKPAPEVKTTAPTAKPPVATQAAPKHAPVSGAKPSSKPRVSVTLMKPAPKVKAAALAPKTPIRKAQKAVLPVKLVWSEGAAVPDLQKGEIALSGTVTSTDAAKQTLTIQADKCTFMRSKTWVPIRPSRTKEVRFNAASKVTRATGKMAFGDVLSGAVVEVTGADSGKGKPIIARAAKLMPPAYAPETLAVPPAPVPEATAPAPPAPPSSDAPAPDAPAQP
jgi:hypothetical protein